MKKRYSKRYKMVIAAFIVLAFMGIVSLFKDMQEVAVSVVLCLSGVIGWYNKQETDRPSVKNDGQDKV